MLLRFSCSSYFGTKDQNYSTKKQASTTVKKKKKEKEEKTKINDPHLLSFVSVHFLNEGGGSAVVLTDQRESSPSRRSEIQNQP
jgi:uncharacterized protein YqhQ